LKWSLESQSSLQDDLSDDDSCGSGGGGGGGGGFLFYFSLFSLCFSVSVSVITRV